MSSCLPYHTSFHEYVSYYRVDSIPDSVSEKNFVNLKFYILGTRGARILFSGNIRPNGTARVYDISLGGDHNTKVVVRKQLSVTGIGVVQVWERESVLRPNEPNEINITISKSKFELIFENIAVRITFFYLFQRVELKLLSISMRDTLSMIQKSFQLNIFHSQHIINIILNIITTAPTGKTQELITTECFKTL